MPIYQSFLESNAEIVIWKIEESESYFKNFTGLTSFIKSDKRRIEYYVGRFLLKKLLPKINLEDIKIDEIGKPYLENSNYSFSISHSFPYVTVLVSTSRNAGIDIQIFKDKIIRLQDKFMSDSEIDMARNDIKLITLMWSAKEAMYKWIATGGQDFSDHLCVDQWQDNNDYYLINGTIKEFTPINKHHLTLKGIINEHFAMAYTLSGALKPQI